MRIEILEAKLRDLLPKDVVSKLTKRGNKEPPNELSPEEAVTHLKANDDMLVTNWDVYNRCLRKYIREIARDEIDVYNFYPLIVMSKKEVSELLNKYKSVLGESKIERYKEKGVWWISFIKAYFEESDFEKDVFLVESYNAKHIDSKGGFTMSDQKVTRAQGLMSKFESSEIMIEADETLDPIKSINYYEDGTMIAEVPSGFLATVPDQDQTLCVFVDKDGVEHEVECEDPAAFIQTDDVEVELPTEEDMQNEAFKTVVRDGVKVKKLVCRKGYKSQNGVCVKMTAKEINARKKAGQKLGKLSRRTAKLASTKKARALSMKKRAALGL